MLGGTKHYLAVIALVVAIAACASNSPPLVEKAWHRSPSLPHDQAMLYMVAEWSAVQKLHPGMTEPECESVLRVPVTFGSANSILYSTNSKGVEYEVALRS